MRSYRFVLVGLVLLFSWSAQAYQDPELARAADAYLKAIKQSQKAKPNPRATQPLLNQARADRRARRFNAAIRGFEAVIFHGRRDARVWYELSNALAQRRPPLRKRGLAAAYNGYLVSKTNPDKALGLWHIASHYQNLRRFKKAMAAYEASMAANPDRRVKSAYDRLAQRFKLLVKRIKTDTESDSPRVCVEFTKPLDKRAGLRFGDYVRIKPAVKMAVTARGRNLCIEGVTHGASYELTVLKGLPGAEDLTLGKTGRYNVVVPNREASLAFKGSAFILPTKGRQGLPVTSVNVDKAKIEVFRINDRAIVELVKARKISKLLDGYDANKLRNRDGERIWSGSLSIKSVANKEVTTIIPVERLLKQRKPGIYVAIAAPASGKKLRNWKSRATQWFVVTDLGVASYMGADGLHISVRSLASAKPMEKVNVLLVARNNDELARGLTDENGMVSFAPGLVRGAGGLRPAAIMAFAKGGEFVFLDLTRPAFDLTDRGVGGRAAPGPVDAYLYTERGVYRPGETVEAVALFRDDRAKALADLPVTLKLMRPDGVEARRWRLKASDMLGGHALRIPLAGSARTGRWTLAAYVNPKGKAVGRVRFQVEDFVPERMEVKLQTKSPVLRAKAANAINVDGRFLYGAPAADLRVESELFLRMNMRPYAKFAGYHFGLVQEAFRQRRISLKTLRTDAKGKAVIPLKLDKLPETTRPLEAQVRVSVLEQGGRATVRTIKLPVRQGAMVIGIKKAFDGAVQDGQKATFEIVTLKTDGTPVAGGGLTYELVREEYRYHWYYRNNRWNYRVTMEEGETTKGAVAVGRRPKSLSFKLPWGAYRLEVRDQRTKAATSVRFRVGWWASVSAGDVPDKLTVSLDKKSYKAGDTAKVFIKTPFEGRVQVAIAGDKLYETRNIEVPAAGKEIELEIDPKWGPSVYVLASAFRPGEQKGVRGPARAIGLAHIVTDMSERTLKVAIEAPKKITPRGKVTVDLKVEGMTRGGKAFVTLAAVDEGILQLTDFKSPSPDTHYYGKRRLALELRDDYGRLIDPGKGAFGTLRQGGDAASKRHLSGLDASSVKTVSLFSGIVRVDGEGRAKVTLDVPDFNGRLRLMAVAWSGEKVGSGEGAITVRDAVVSVVTLPRFLAPRDVAQMTVSLHNVDGRAGQYRLILDGKLVRQVGAKRGPKVARLKKNQRTVITYRLTAARVGVGRINLRIEGPRGYKIARGWDIAVRPAQTVLTRRLAKQIQPGQSVRYTQAMLAAFVPGTAEVSLGFSTAPNLNLASLLKRLDRYPYGCAEQTTSRALPLLYVADLAKSLGIAEDRTILRGRVQKAIGRIMTMQRSDGAFGLWSAFSPREEWLTGYVMDFLTQARKLKYPVPESGYERGLSFLASRVADPDFEVWQLPSRAYAFYVLAKAGKARIADLRYFNDTYLKQMPTALAMAQTGAALALLGDTARADRAFAAAFDFKARTKKAWRSWAYWDYGSNLRDQSGMIYLAASSKQGGARIGSAIGQLVELARDDTYTSTQEQAWLSLVAHTLTNRAKSMKLDVAGKRLDRKRPLYMVRKAAMLGGGLRVTNRGAKPVWHSATLSGIPRAEQPRASQGLSIKRTYHTLDGKPADLTKVRQGQILVAVIKGEATSNLRHQALVVDLLPSGFEIENARLRGRASVKQLKWLPKLTRALHVQPRDDRWVAALNLRGGKKRSFTFAYLVRAVTPGTFRLPAAYVEDMYKPRYFGRDAMGKVVVTAVR